MIDSMNARRDTNPKYTNIEFRNMKKEIKDKIVSKNAEIVTSEYFEYFDERLPIPMHFRQQYFLNIAAQIATSSDMNHKHGAIIVHRKNVIAFGHNHYFSNMSIHAEVSAISQIRGKDKDILQECEMYVVRIGPDRFNTHLKYSKPCHNCQKFITKKCIKKVFYSTNYTYDETIAEYLYNKANPICSECQ